jgi:hypothetical protein
LSAAFLPQAAEKQQKKRKKEAVNQPVTGVIRLCCLPFLPQ